MARQNKPGADDHTVEGIPHDHGDGDRNHLHRLGDLSHIHRDDGKAILLDQQGEPLFINGGEPLPAPPEPDGDLAKAIVRDEHQEQAAERRRAEIAAAVTDEDRADMERIRTSHPDILTGPRPAGPPAVAGPPGHSIGDVAANDVLDSVLFDDADPVLKAERVWLRLATTTALRMAAEFHRYGKVADAGLLMAFRDQAEQLVTNRGLTGGGS